MLHVSICCKLFVSKALLKGSKEMEIRGCKIRTVRIMAPNLPAVVTSPVTSLVGSMGPSDFCLSVFIWS